MNSDEFYIFHFQLSCEKQVAITTRSLIIDNYFSFSKTGRNKRFLSTLTGFPIQLGNLRCKMSDVSQ